MTQCGVKGARKSVQWTDFSPERAKRRAGCRRFLRRTATGCRPPTWPAKSWRRSLRTARWRRSCRMSTSRSTARWSRRSPWVSNRWRHHGSPSMKSFQPKPEAAPLGGDRPDDPSPPPPPSPPPAACRRCRNPRPNQPGDRPDDHRKTQRSQCRSRLSRPSGRT